MKKKIKTIFKKIFKNSHFIKYIKDLSITILGVFVTLWLIGIIADNKTDRNVDMVINLIKMEMESNLKSLNGAQQKWENEQQVYGMIIKQNFNIQNIPVDTLIKHKNIIGDKHSFYVSNDSYEVFKLSQLMQHIEKKIFLRKLSKAYGTCDLISEKLSRYSNQKLDGINDLIYSTTDNKTINKFLNGSIYDFYTMPLNNHIFRINIYSGNSIISKTEFEECRKMLTSIINMIDNEEYK